MSDLTKKQMEHIAIQNDAIRYLGKEVSNIKKNQSVQAKYRSKTARSKGRANRLKKGQAARNLKGMASLDSVKLKGFGSSPLK